MAPPIKTPSILADLRAFVLAVPADTPYDQLAGLLRDAGWTWYLRQAAAEGLHDGSVLLTFDVQVGRDDHPLTTIDQVSTHLGAQPGPVSLAARMGLDQTLIHMVFGRLPPIANTAPVVDPPLRAQAPTRTVEMNGHDSDDFYLPDEPVQEYVNDAPVLPQLDVVAKREPDGLPLFVDLYAVEAPAGDVIEAVLSELKAFLDMATTEQQVMAVASKNPDALAFIKDLGEEEDSKALRALVAKRRGQIAGGIKPAAPEPRRRTPARGH